MITVQFRYGTDNLGYLVHGDEYALAVDGGAVMEMVDYLGRNKLKLVFVTNTHSHGDHTCGNRELIRLSGAEFLDVKNLPEMGSIGLEDMLINIFHTPGHTADSVCFRFGDAINRRYPV
ncbi:MAG: MBL fold metallo-hydrolase [Candidatus Sabulitectum sp.]|nr:MBL fold metallo-hydrolase [Candidatus Sabulitectum sp.]